eukprot:3424971-Prymnesium_polylepis.1
MVFVRAAAPLAEVWNMLNNASVQINLSSPARMQVCAQRRAEVTLNECQNLAPAGTGTKSLKKALENATARKWKHFHWMRLVPSKPAPCAIMTLRDPVERLESAFRYELNSSNKHASAHSPFTMRGVAPSLREFVEAIRNHSHPRHKAALSLYRRSAYLPGAFLGEWTSSSQLLDNFLVSTINYLRGLDCQKTEVHFVCTNRFDTQWRSLLRSFGYQHPPSVPHLNNRSALVPSSVSAAARLSSSLDAQYVRQTLYPWDSRLYEAACGREQPAAVQNGV